ncbi:MAG: hypothetical protein ABRQ39_09210 [Candidatus Eremiobacterota bacterium]
MLQRKNNKINRYWLFYYRVELDCKFPLISYVTKQSVEEMSLKKEKIVKSCFKATSVHIIKI